MRLETLANRRVAIWGAGREGLSLARLLANKLPGLVVTLLNDTPLEKGSLQALPNIGETIEGSAIADRLAQFDVVFKSPGISLYRPEIIAAGEQGVQFTSATQLWFDEHPRAKTVCITGTKGKSTTSALVAALLQTTPGKTVLAGNIGVPLTDVFDEEGVDVWVIELSSYQTADLDIQPHIATLLNLFPEHLDWHLTKENYFADKCNLLTKQPADITVLNAADENSNRICPDRLQPLFFNHRSGIHVQDGQLFNGEQALFALTDLPLRGEHNFSNICAALTIYQALGHDPKTARPALESFRPLPHRLETVARLYGIEYIDDSISTVPEAAIEAIKAMNVSPVTILLGGYDRQLDYTGLVNFIVSRAAEAPINVITMGQSGRRIQALLEKYPATPGLSADYAKTLPQAMEKAVEKTRRGGVILLSPAAPSYGEFRSFSERGEHFRQLARALADKGS